jgi:phosphatidylinositol alpha-1,6-mannosyltransferase
VRFSIRDVFVRAWYGSQMEPTGGVIFMVGEFPPIPGGNGAEAFHVADGLRRLGVTVRVLCPMQHVTAQEATAFDARACFPIVRFAREASSPIGMFLQRRRLKSWCRRQRPGCLLASGRRAAWMVAAVAHDLKLPWAVLAQGSEYLDTNPRRLERTRRCLMAADAVITISRYTTNLVTRLGVPPEKLRLLRCGASLAALPEGQPAAALRRRWGLEGKRILLTVGRVSRRKAQDVTIRAMPAILKSVPDAVFLAVGMPAAREEFERLARELGVADRVVFAGVAAPEELPLYYRLCDLFILNSRVTAKGECEGFGIVLIEAGLAGRPVIGTRGCGAEEAVEHEVTGLLVAPDAPGEVAQAALRILSDPELARRMGESGRRRAVTLFSWDKLSRDIHQILSPWLR